MDDVGSAASLTDAVGLAIADVGAAGAAAAPRPLSVSDRTGGGAVSTVSLEYAVGSDGRLYGAGDTVPDGDGQTVDLELIKSAFGWIAMAQVRGPRRTECVGWSGAAEGDQLDSLLSADARTAARQALAMLQSKGCLAAPRPAFPPIPVAAAAAVAPKPRRRRGLVSVAAFLLLGTLAVVLAVGLRPDTGGDEAAAPATTLEGSGPASTGKTTSTTTTSAPTTTTTLSPPTTAGSPPGIASNPGGGGGGGSGGGDCDEFAGRVHVDVAGRALPDRLGRQPLRGAGGRRQPVRRRPPVVRDRHRGRRRHDGVRPVRRRPWPVERDPYLTGGGRRRPVGLVPRDLRLERPFWLQKSRLRDQLCSQNGLVRRGPGRRPSTRSTRRPGVG